MALTVDQFSKALVSSGLMTAEELMSLWAEIPAADRPQRSADFAQLLVAREKLTSFQTQELLAGRGGRLVMGDYVVLTKIGAGGMGQVYKARHRRMKRIVALKVMSNAAMRDEAAVKRFQREVQAAARLEHENIVTAYASGEAGDVKYLVMQFVDGGDLSQLVKSEGPLPLERAVDYVLQAATGLAYAHREGVIHRDIKPANLLLDKKGTIKILDMGLARIEGGEDGLTATEQVMGTVDYMSPEQATNTKTADARADIYALGCTLWYLLTGKKVYESDSLIGRLMAHRDAPLPSLVKARDDAPWPLEQAFHKMIAKRPQDRFQSMDEVMGALAPYRGDSPSSGSSSGLSSGGGRSADLASFMQSMGTGATKAGAPSAVRSAPSASIDGTTGLAGADVGTDPKSAPLPSGAPAEKTGSPSSLSTTSASKSRVTTKQGSTRRTQRRLAFMLAGAAGLAILVAGIVIQGRNGKSNIVAERTVPQQTSSEVAAPLPSRTVIPAASADTRAAKTLSVPELLESTDYVWSQPENLGPNINSGATEQAPTLTADQLCLIFIRTGAGSDLLEARRPSIAAAWGKPVRLQGSDQERDPSLSPDGLTLCFCSNGWKGPGYVGGYDIWIRRRANRDAPWGPPENFGPPVNTSSNEGGPTLSADGLMVVFHSSGLGGRGSHDLYVSRRASLAAPWSVPENLGGTINSSAGEMNPRLIDGDKSILFERSGNLHITFRNSTGAVGAISLPNQSAKYSWPWLTSDGGTLYFHAGGRPDGLGSDDIWLTRRVPKQRL